MKGRVLWLALSCLMVLSMVLASCTTTTEEEEEEEEEVVVEEEEEEEEEEEGGPPPAGGNWWDKYGEPEYGGTLTVRVVSFNTIYDTWYGGPFGGVLYQYETPFWYDYTLDREIWPFLSGFTPVEYMAGALAESWEVPDMQTVILNIRQGVNFQDKPPVNGRELTAYDVEHHYHRILGIGSGYTEVTPYYSTFKRQWESVTALDKYTVEIKFFQPIAVGLYSTMEAPSFNQIDSPEAAALYKPSGIVQDWQNAVGTGPWMISDVVIGSSLTWDKNPNYWGYDERHPDNRLPYIDKLKILCIPDIATAMSAVRTGKLDFLEEIDWEQKASLERTNPELLSVEWPAAGYTLDMRNDTEPFTDIRVRKAMQMAIDREMIAETHFGGTVDGKPSGIVSTRIIGWNYPYEDWPQELKDEYSYNPDRARELLAEAGYPSGFKAICRVSTSMDLEFLQIVKAQLLDLGVDLEIIVMDPTAFSGFARAGHLEQMAFTQYLGQPWPPPWSNLELRAQYPSNFTYNNDPVFEEMVARISSTADPAEPKQICIAADKYCIEQHWSVHTFEFINYTVYQPYLKGYSGEYLQRDYAYYARWWIDQELKKSMGR